MIHFIMVIVLLLVFFYFIWLMTLQLQLSRLSDKIDLLLKEKNKSAPAQETPDEEVPPAPAVTSVQEEPKPEPVMNATISRAEESVPQPAPAEKTKEPEKPISFVELFSWVGGFILLLGVLFWIKYALENNLISPVMRIMLGTATGIGMWIAGAALRKPNVKTTSDTLCACGLCICYAVWFAAYYFYHMTSPAVTFILLALVAMASFATAVWKNAQYIGVLAQLVGFVTPFLFPSDSPRIWFLLLYVAIINVAAVAAALKRNWTHQLFTGLIFTFLCFLAIINVSNSLQLAFFPGIFALFYTAIAIRRQHSALLRCAFALAAIGLLALGNYTLAFPTQSLVSFMLFAAFFSIGFGLLSAKQNNKELSFYALGFAFVSFLFMAKAPSFSLLFIFIMLLCAAFAFIATSHQERAQQIGSIALAAVGFITLVCSQPISFTQSAHLPYLTGFTVLFALFFGCIAYKQKNKEIMLFTIALTLLCFGWLVPFKNEFYLTALAGIFTLFFGITSARMKEFSLQLASVLFTSICILLICMLGQLNLHLVIGAALAAAIFYGYFAVKQKSGALLASAAASLIPPFVMLCGYTLYNHRGNELLWWLISWNLLTMFTPFYFKEHFKESKSAWSAVTGCNLLAGTLMLIVCLNTPSLTPHVGAISFILAVAYGAFAERIYAWQKLEEGIQHPRMSGLVWAPILFLTFGILQQCTLQWKTIALAVEGVTLIWLWHGIKLNFLQNVGMGILLLAATRLLLNPFIASYYPQVNPLLNWYLYTYIIGAWAMFAGASHWRKITPPSPAPKVLRIIGGVLLFALVNIEIACYFSDGRGLTFDICGELTEAATYTIAWAICGALCMFLATPKSKGLLQVGIGLIALAVLKLFLADIWQLSSGLRVAALFAVAIIMLGVSFVYQQARKSNR